jgi:membrane protease YdiL (CAAX protease family)
MKLLQFTIYIGLIAVSVSGFTYWIPKYLPDDEQQFVSSLIVSIFSVVSASFAYYNDFNNGTWSWVTVASTFILIGGLIFVLVYGFLPKEANSSMTPAEQEVITAQNEHQRRMAVNIYSIIVLIGIILSQGFDNTAQGIANVTMGFTGAARRVMRKL